MMSKKPHLDDKKYIQLCILLIVIGFAVRLSLALYHEVSGDACWHLSSARFIAQNKEIPLNEGLGRLEPFWPPPMFHAIAAFFSMLFGLFGIPDIGLRLASPVLGTLAAVASFFLLKKFLSKKLLFYSMTFVNFTPLLLDFFTFGYVDSAAAFFSILAVYLMIERRHFLAAISFSFAMLSKYNIIFMIPLAVYLAFETSSKNNRIRNFAYLAGGVLISSLWLVRNWIYFKNPVWPFMNGLFNGLDVGVAFNSFKIANIFSLNPYVAFYLEIFGVPNGNIATISFIPPSLKPAALLWIVATAAFIIPFFFQKKKGSEGRDDNILRKSAPWALVPLGIMLLIYLVTTGWFSPRLLLPAIPFFAYYWAIGLGNSKIKWHVPAVIIISLCFVLSFALKLSIAKSLWMPYQEDFRWAMENSQKNSVFYGNGQCTPYKIGRLVIYSSSEDGITKADYIWINDKWNVDFRPESEFEARINMAKGQGKISLVYDNPKSGTKIYSVKK